MVQRVVNQILQHPAEQQQPQLVVKPNQGHRLNPVILLPLRLQQSEELTIPMGIPTPYSSSSFVRMVSNGIEARGDVVMLDGGSDVSLLLFSYGQCREDAVNLEQVQLRDCQGKRLQVTGHRTVSFVAQ